MRCPQGGIKNRAEWSDALDGDGHAARRSLPQCQCCMFVPEHAREEAGASIGVENRAAGEWNVSARRAFERHVTYVGMVVDEEAEAT